MALPDLIEIVPPDKPVRAEVTVPGSKSITNRALVLAALADGEVTLEGALWSEDTQVMSEALRTLGFDVRLELDPEEICNRTISVRGLGGRIPNAGTTGKPLELFVGNAGTAARFLAAMVCLGEGVYRLSGVPRMHERPQAELFRALRELGYRVECDNGNEKLPVRIFGCAPVSLRAVQPLSPKYEAHLTVRAPFETRRSCIISIAESSQFASALLLCANKGGWKIDLVGENPEESPYVVMTSALINVFPDHGGRFEIEPDASSGSYMLAAGCLIPEPEYMEYSEHFQTEVLTQRLNKIEVAHWPCSGWQVDERFRDFLHFADFFHQLLELRRTNKEIDANKIHQAYSQFLSKPRRHGFVSRKDDLGDSIMLAIVYNAGTGSEQSLFTDLGRLRVQECERVAALRTELTKCGANVLEDGDTLTIFPSKLHGAEIETHNDHRMAMCFAILGLKVPGIRIKNPACVKKTFPNFFQKLAAPPPKGLGVTILDGRTGQQLSDQELFAE